MSTPTTTHVPDLMSKFYTDLKMKLLLYFRVSEHVPGYDWSILGRITIREEDVERGGHAQEEAGNYRIMQNVYCSQYILMRAFFEFN